jgi:molybdopterin molybdotransferase
MDDLPRISQRIGRLTPLVDALACIDRLVAPVGACRIPLDKAAGFTLAEDIANRDAHPGSAIALRDGIAVAAEATLDASSYAPVRLPGAPAFVDVGDTLPSGADAVAAFDVVEIRDGAAYALTPAASGDGVLPRGADAAPGDVLGRAGTRLRASDVEALSVLGVREVAVREPLVRIAVANSPADAVIGAVVGLLWRTIQPDGANVVIPSPGQAGLDDVLERPGGDAIILVGGSGAGRRDRSVHDLARRGSVGFHGVGLSPGETAAFGTVENRPVLILPGRLDAALVAWLMLGRRMLARLCGRRDDDAEPRTPVVLARKIASTLGLAEVVPVKREADGVVPLASGYLALQALVRADGYIVVPAESEGYPAGACVDMWPLP